MYKRGVCLLVSMCVLFTVAAAVPTPVLAQTFMSDSTGAAGANPPHSTASFVVRRIAYPPGGTDSYPRADFPGGFIMGDAMHPDVVQSATGTSSSASATFMAGLAFARFGPHTLSADWLTNQVTVSCSCPSPGAPAIRVDQRSIGWVVIDGVRRTEGETEPVEYDLGDGYKVRINETLVPTLGPENGEVIVNAIHVIGPNNEVDFVIGSSRASAWECNRMPPGSGPGAP